MPKTGLSDAEWRKRLSQFAAGKFQFGRGQRPQKGSIRAKVLERVEKCPKHLNPVMLDPFKRKIKCHCGYHIPHIVCVYKFNYDIVHNKG